MADRTYLISGHTSSGALKPIDKRVLDEADDKNILVLNLTFSDVEKLDQKQEFFIQYFDDLGADNIDFILKGTKRGVVRKAFKSAGVLYLPGGDTKLFIQNIREMGLEPLIKGFDGIVSGNSAGAYALCPEYLRIGHGDTEVIPALGIMDFWIKAHYKKEFDSELRRLSQTRTILALEDSTAIIDHNGERMNFIGRILRFEDGLIDTLNF